MRRAPQVALAPEEQRVLERWAAQGSGTGRLARRSLIILGAARGRTNAEIAADLATNPETVARWRSRFVVNGLEGVEREAPRSGHTHRAPSAVVERILSARSEAALLTDGAWSTRKIARTLRINHMLVHRVLKAHEVEIVAPGGDRAPTTPRVDVAGAILTPNLRAVVFSIATSADRPGGTDSASIEAPDVRVDAMAADPLGASTTILRALRRLERVPRRRLRAASSSAPLLVFLRGLEQSFRRAARLDVVTDRGVERLEPATRTWLRAHPRFSLHTPRPGEGWSDAAAAWLGRWESGQIDGESFAHARALDAAFRNGASNARRGFERFSWRPTSA